MEYINKGKEILKILINNGYEAYFVGEVVRDTIMKLPYNEIEITTGATPEAIKEIFADMKIEMVENWKVKLKYFEYDFFISTFHVEEYRDRRTLLRVHYSKNLNDDLKCRDYTIDAIAMSHSEKIMDGFGGYDDIRRKKIRLIGRPNTRLSEEPVRILKAIRLVSELNFKINKHVLAAMRRQKKLLVNASFYKIAQEMEKIMNGRFHKKAVKQLIYLNIHKYLGFLRRTFKLLDRHYLELNYDQFILLAFLIEGKVVPEFLEFATYREVVEKAYNLAISQPKSLFTKFDFFDNGIEICLLANKMNLYLHRSRKSSKQILRKYNMLAIKTKDEVEISEIDIRNMLVEEKKQLSESIYKETINSLLNGEVNNNREDLLDFVTIKLRDQALLPENKVEYGEVGNFEVEKKVLPEDDIEKLNKDLNLGSVINATDEEEIALNLKKQGQVIKDYTEYRLDMLERRINEQERLIKEKDLQIDKLAREARKKRIEEDVENLVQRNLELLKESKLDNLYKNKEELEKKLFSVYMNYIYDAMEKYPVNEVENEKD